MKTKTFWKWSLGVSLAVLPLVGCSQKSVTTNPAPAIVQSQPVFTDFESTSTAPIEPQQNLEDAVTEIIAPAAAPSETLSPAASEIVKLAQAGVDESVMMAYLSNSTDPSTLTSDDIVYLKDVGVPDSVLTTMIQRNPALYEESATAAMVSPPPVYTNPPVFTAGAPTPYETPATDEPVNTAMAEPIPQAEQANVSYTYFYNSLAPYGTWVNVQGYGLCWQPTVVAVNPNWQPYSDQGRWVYTDYGWHWASDYSWGWAPFHYGRWFRHSRIGWCWAPDTVWGPSWVSWRYSAGYYGWAPLPPAACYSPGYGFSYYGSYVGIGFSFGISSSCYTYVPVYNFCDRYAYRHRVSHHRANELYHETKPIHRYDRGERNQVINRGIPVEHVRTATRTDIRPIPTRITDRPGPARMERNATDNSQRLAIYRPELPQPEGRPRLVGQGVRPATRSETIRNLHPAPSANTAGSVTRSQPGVPSRSIVREDNRPDRLNETVPSVIRSVPNSATPNPSTPSRASVGPARETPTITPRTAVQTPQTTSQPDRRAEPIIIRGPNRSTVANTTPPAVTGEPAPTAPASIRQTPTWTRPTSPAVRPSAPSTQASIPNTPSPGTSVRQTPPVRQVQPTPQPAPAPRSAPGYSVRETQQIYRQQIPRVNAPVQVPPSMPVQRQQPTPSYQAPRAIEQPRYNPPPQVRSVPRMQSQPAPQIQMRQPQMSSPAIRSSPTPQPQPSPSIRSMPGGDRRIR